MAIQKDPLEKGQLEKGLYDLGLISFAVLQCDGFTNMVKGTHGQSCA